MRIKCANCHGEFRGRYTQHMIWCKNDDMYVCEVCWKGHCNEGHGKGSKNIGWNTLSIVLFPGIFIIILVLPFLIPGFIDIHIRSKWDGIETVSVTEVSDGELVRLEGNINESAETIAIGRKEGRKDWAWDDDSEFRFNDSSGSVRVTTERYYDIEDGPHPPVNEKDSDGSAYLGGDRVIIIGYAEVNGNSTAILLLWMGTDGDDVKPSSGLYIGMGFLSVIIAVSFVFVLRILAKRNKLHEKSLQTAPPAIDPGNHENEGIPATDSGNHEIDEIPAMDPAKCEIDETGKSQGKGSKDSAFDELDWHSNAGPLRKQRRLILPAFIIACILTIWFIARILDLHTQIDYALMWLPIVPYTLVFMMTIPGFCHNNPIEPDSIAISDKSIQLHYEDPVMQKLRIGSIAWNEILKISYRSGGKSTHLVIETKNHYFMDICRLTGLNRKLVLSRWEKYLARGWDRL